MISVDVVSEDRLWNTKLKKPNIFFGKLIKLFPKRYFFKNKKVNLTVLLSNNKNIQKLNKRFRKKNKPTDILSFPLDKKINKKKYLYLGDIIISYNFILKPKSLTIKEFQEKLIRIFIHGFLHLLNYDHIKLKDYKKMNKEETKIYKFIHHKIEKLD